MPLVGVCLCLFIVPLQTVRAGLEPMLQAQSSNGLAPMVQSTTQTGLVPLADMVETSGTISPTALVALASETVQANVALAAMESRMAAAEAPLVVMVNNGVVHASALVAMENRIEPAAAPLIAMDNRQRQTQGMLVAMVDAKNEGEVALASAAPTGFGAVVGPVAAAEGGIGGAMVAGGAVTGSLPSVGAAAVVATTLPTVREAAQPKGSGAEVLMSLQVNREDYADVIVAYRNSALQGDVLLPLSAISAALGLGVEVDGARGVASGWLMSNAEPLSLDIAKGEVVLGQRHIAIKPGQVAVGGEEIFISGALLAELLGGEMVANFHTLELTMTTAQTLPMQAAKERAARWARSTATNPYKELMAQAQLMDYPFASLPTVGLDYSRGWARALGDKEGLALSGESLNMQLQGTLFYAAANFGIGLERNEKGDLSLTGGNVSFSRDAPSPTLLADWLGPLAARRIEFGDIGATSVPLASVGVSGRGVRMTNAPAGLVDDPERFVLEGDAPAGWDVEVYQNAGLLAFQKASVNNRYRFQALPLRPGMNDFRIVLYGPRGEQETRTARYVLGDSMLAKGQLTYDVSLYEPSVPVFEVGTRKALKDSQPTLTQRYAYGVTTNLTAILAAYTGLTDNEKTLTAPAQAVAAGLRGTLLDTYWQAEALTGRDGTRRFASSLARQLPWGIGARTGFSTTYGSTASGLENQREFSLDLNKAIDIADVTVDNAVTYRRTMPEEGYMTQAVQLRTGLALQDVGITNELEAKWRERGVMQYDGNVALSRPVFGGYARAAFTYRPNDAEGLWRTMDATYQRALTEKLYFDARYQQNLQGDQAQRYTGKLDYQLADFSLGLSAYGDDSGDYGGQLSLRTQLQPGAKGYEIANAMESRSAGAATVNLLVFVDDNGNQVLDPGETPMAGVKIDNISRNTSQISNPAGEVVFKDIPSNIPVRLEVDMEEIPDIYVRAPVKPLVVYGQAGAKGDYILPLRRVGEVNGYILREGREGQKSAIAGLKLMALNAEGKIMARTRTEGDGFFVLDNLPLGTYQIAVDVEDGGEKGFGFAHETVFTLKAKTYVVEDVELFVKNKE